MRKLKNRLMNLFKSKEDIRKEVLNEIQQLPLEERIEVLAPIVGVEPQFLSKRLSEKPISKRAAGRLLGLDDHVVGAARQIQHTSREAFAFRTLGITKEQFEEMTSGNVTKVHAPSMDVFFQKILEVYEPEDGWTEKSYQDFFDRIHKLSDLESIIGKIELTPKILTEILVDIIINAYKGAYTSNYGKVKKRKPGKSNGKN